MTKYTKKGMRDSLNKTVRIIQYLQMQGKLSPAKATNLIISLQKVKEKL